MNRALFDMLKFHKVPSDILCLIEVLNDSKQEALHKLLKFENSTVDGFSLRKRNITDLYQFDYELNAIASKLLCFYNPRYSENRISSFFSFTNHDEELSILQRDGYLVSPQRLGEAKTASIRSALGKMRFAPKNKANDSKLGDELISIGNQKNQTMEAGTFWLSDMNKAVQNPILASLAFDPYILNMASNYLGCTPIHVQTNAWFSFPVEDVNKQLSTSAQLFHQDKEFTKFIKVFIYLNEVGPDNGPHCYIKGSHLNELYKQGVPLTSRLSDEDALKYYSQENIMHLCGPEGTVVFGDTCSVHKGTPLKHGFRMILQFEYAASLYMSPIEPFDQLEQSLKATLQHLPKRCLLNYDSSARKRYLKQKSSNGLISSVTKRADSWFFNRKLKAYALKFKDS